jgi:hypothetical protein
VVREGGNDEDVVVRTRSVFAFRSRMLVEFLAGLHQVDFVVGYTSSAHLLQIKLVLTRTVAC